MPPKKYTTLGVSLPSKKGRVPGGLTSTTPPARLKPIDGTSPNGGLGPATTAKKKNGAALAGATVSMVSALFSALHTNPQAAMASPPAPENQHHRQQLGEGATKPPAFAAGLSLSGGEKRHADVSSALFSETNANRAQEAAMMEVKPPPTQAERFAAAADAIARSDAPQQLRDQAMVNLRAEFGLPPSHVPGLPPSPTHAAPARPLAQFHELQEQQQQQRQQSDPQQQGPIRDGALADGSSAASKPQPHQWFAKANPKALAKQSEQKAKFAPPPKPQPEMHLDLSSVPHDAFPAKDAGDEFSPNDDLQDDDSDVSGGEMVFESGFPVTADQADLQARLQETGGQCRRRLRGLSPSVAPVHAPATFLKEITEFVQKELLMVDARFPAVRESNVAEASEYALQPQELLLRVNGSATTTPAEQWKRQRLEVFQVAQRLFSDAFPTYRLFLDALADEHETYAKFLEDDLVTHKEVLIGMRHAFKAEMLETDNRLAEAEAKIARMAEEIADKDAKVERLRATLLTANRERHAKETQSVKKRLFELESKFQTALEVNHQLKEDIETLQRQNEHLWLNTFSDALEQANMNLTELRESNERKDDMLNVGNEELTVLGRDLRNIVKWFHTKGDIALGPKDLRLGKTSARLLWPEGVHRASLTDVPAGGYSSTPVRRKNDKVDILDHRALAVGEDAPISPKDVPPLGSVESAAAGAAKGAAEGDGSGPGTAGSAKPGGRSGSRQQRTRLGSHLRRQAVSFEPGMDASASGRDPRPGSRSPRSPRTPTGHRESAVQFGSSGGRMSRIVSVVSSLMQSQAAVRSANSAGTSLTSAPNMSIKSRQSGVSPRRGSEGTSLSGTPKMRSPVQHRLSLSNKDGPAGASLSRRSPDLAGSFR